MILLLMSWLTPLLLILIKLGSRGPLFFKQERVGYRGRRFSILKFRTMFLNHQADLSPSVRNDKRITKVGRFLRNTGIDELPQLFNILRGEMSFIGPRPHMVSEEVRFCSEIKGFAMRHAVIPGITGLAQVKGCRGVISRDRSAAQRLRWDMVYIRKRGFGLEWFIFKNTVCQLGGYLFGALKGKREKASEKTEPNDALVNFEYGLSAADYRKAHPKKQRQFIS